MIEVSFCTEQQHVETVTLSREHPVAVEIDFIKIDFDQTLILNGC